MDSYQHAVQELESLGRVYHRLIETPQGLPFQNVVGQLLPRLLSRIGQNHQRMLDQQSTSDSATVQVSLKELHDNIHAKYLDMMMHIMKRVRPDEGCKIPCVAIAHLLVDHFQMKIFDPRHMDSFTLNFSLAFLTIGSIRCNLENAHSMFPLSIVMAGAYCGRHGLLSPADRSRSSQTGHIILRLLEKVVTVNQSTGSNHNHEEASCEEGDAAKAQGSYITLTQGLLQDDSTNEALYNLLLDVLLYQSMPISTDLPPPGLSSYGQERLNSGASVVAKDWREEYSSINRLVELKKTILEWIAPNRRWDPFLASTYNISPSYLSRVLTLLVVAMGDSHIEVSDRAETYLRVFFDRRDKNLKSILSESKRNLLLELLSLCLGGIGTHRANNVTINTDVKSMRRMISEKSILSAFNFIALRLLDRQQESPLASLPSGDVNREKFYSEVMSISSMLHYVVSSHLQTSSGRSFTTYSQFHYKTIPAAAGHVLNSFCVHLSTLYDEEKRMMHQTILSRLQQFIAKALALASNHVSSASTDYNTDTSKSVGIDSRNGCYDVICTICRSTLVLDNKAIIFDLSGNEQTERPILDGITSSTFKSSQHFSLAHTLFGCVSNEDSALRLGAMGSLDALLATTIKSFRANDQCDPCLQMPISFDVIARSLMPCLWNAARHKKSKLSRVAAAHWASDFIYFIDLIGAFHVLCFLVGDDDESVSAAACSAFSFAKELDEQNYRNPLSLLPGVTCPTFSNVIHKLFKRSDETDALPSYNNFSPRSKAVTLHLCRLCYNGDDETDKDSLSMVYVALTSTLNKLANGSSNEKDEMNLMDATCAVLADFLSASKYMRNLAVKGLNEIFNLILCLRSSVGQLYLSLAVFHLLSDLSLWTQEFTLSDWLTRVDFRIKLEYCLSQPNIQGASLAAAHYVRAFRLIYSRYPSKVEWPWMLCSKVVAALCEGVSHADDSIAVTCTKSLGVALSALEPKGLILCEFQSEELVTMTLLRTSALEKLNDSFSLASSASNRLYALIRSVGLIMDRVSYETERPIIDKLFDLLSSRILHQDPLLALYVGEALTCAASSHVILQRLLSVELTKASYQTRSSLALCLFAMLAAVLRMVSIHNSASLVEGILCHLPEIHRYFFGILSDKRCSSVGRESSCLGLVVCRSLSNYQGSNQVVDYWKHLSLLLSASSSAEQSFCVEAEALNDRNDLLNDGNSRSEDSELLTVLRVFADIAIVVNNPAVFYSLAIASVSASNQVWTTSWCCQRYNGYNMMQDDWMNSVALRSSLMTQITKVLPTLFVARYDPDKNANIIINNVWSFLQLDSEQSSLSTMFFRPLVDELINSTTSKLWRKRVGSCKALADVIVGKSWLDFGGGRGTFEEDNLVTEQRMSEEGAATRLVRLIRVALRSLDDVRLTVREAGANLSLNLKSVIISLSKEDSSESSSDASAVAAILPYLIKVGINQSCTEATNFSISCLVEIIEVCNPIIIQQYIPSLIGSLLMSLSGVEPAILSHLQARAAGDAPGADREVEQLRLRIADRSTLTSAITKILNMVPLLHPESQRLVVFHLDQALRNAHGLTTRNAVIDAIVSLCCKCAIAFDSNPSTTRLLNALVVAMDQEKKDTLLRSKLSYAFGYVANLAPAKTVRFLAVKACDSYLENPDSVVHRKSAASTIKSIFEKASRHLDDGGPNDIWRKNVLPIAYIGKNDDTEISIIWKDVWEEGSSIKMSKVSDHGVNLEERILPGIMAYLLQLLQDRSWFLRRLACTSLIQLSGILSPSTIAPRDYLRLSRRVDATIPILNGSLVILAKRQLWSGKDTLVQAVVTITCNWLPVPVNKTTANVDSASASDLDDVCNSQLSTHYPLDMWPIVAYGSWDDLLDGDKWFQRYLLKPEEGYNSTSTDELIGHSVVVTSDDTCERGQGYEVKHLIADTAHAIASVTGIVHCLLEQATLSPNSMVLGLSETELLPYKTKVLENLALLLNTVQSSFSLPSGISKDFHIHTYNTLKVYMLDSAMAPPVLVARAVSCVAASVSPGIDDFSELLTQINQLSKHVAWTVRESSILALSKLVQRATIRSLKKLEVLESLISLAFDALKEKKFHRVRLAGILLLSSLCDRGNQKFKSISDDSNAETVLLHALLPFKERVLIAARKSLADDDASIVDATSKLCTQLSQWP